MKPEIGKSYRVVRVGNGWKNGSLATRIGTVGKCVEVDSGLALLKFDGSEYGEWYFFDWLEQVEQD